MGRARKGYKSEKYTTHEQDKELVIQANGGDSKAYNILAQKYKPILYTAAKRRLPHKEVEDLEDIVMAVMGAAFVKIHQYNPEKSKFITRWPGWEVQLTPDNYFKRLSKLKIGGYEYPIPSKANEYLEYIYGEDWETPKSRSGVNQKLEFISREEGQSYAYSHSQKDFKKK